MFVAFIIPSVIISVFGVLLTIAKWISKSSNVNAKYGLHILCRAEKLTILSRLREFFSSQTMHTMLDELILSAADTQLLLILAFGVSFYSSFQCEVSLYHYLIAIHMIQVGLTTSALSYTLARSSYKSYISLLIRTALFWIDWAGLTRTLDHNHFEVDAQFMRKVPSGSQRDSIIVLPAFCLLEGMFDPLNGLSQPEQSHLTHTGLTRVTNYSITIVGCLGGVAFIGTYLHLGYLLCTKQYYRFRDDNDRVASTKRKAWQKVIRFLWGCCRLTSWGLCTAFLIWNWVSITSLRDWINGSVWIDLVDNKNPERGVKGIGQFTPLVALGAIVLTFTNSLSKEITKYMQGTGESTASGSYTKM